MSTDNLSSQAQAASERPEPTTLADALARKNNTTPEQAWELCIKAKWGFCEDGSESPYEYDQGDRLVVEYDDLFQVADIALTALKLLRTPTSYDFALHCSDCGHFLLPHDVEGHNKWHEEPRR